MDYLIAILALGLLFGLFAAMHLWRGDASATSCSGDGKCGQCPGTGDCSTTEDRPS